MHIVIPRRLGPAAFLALALAACLPPSTGGGGGGTSSGSVCATDPRATAYAIGLSAKATDGALRATFVDALPAPPTRGENAWTIKLTDAMGSPVSGATITVKPFMPDHGHGSSITPQVTPMSAAGTYQVTLLDFFMPGIWQVTFTVTPASGPPDTVVFTFCVDG